MFSNIFTDLGTFQDIHTFIGHPDGASTNSGIFRHVSSYDQALDQNTKNHKMQSFNKNVNNSGLWYCAEYQLGFDPCVCNYPSTFRFDFKAIKTFNIKIEGRAVAASIPLKNSSGVINYDAFLTGLNKNSDASGNLLYKSLDSMLYHYDKELLAYNTKLKDFNNIENQAKRELIKLAKGGIEGLAPTLLPTTNLTKFLVKNSLDIAKWKLPKDSAQAKDWTEGMQKGLKSLLGKGYDELSYTIFGKEFFKEPQRPSMPLATLTDMRLTGTIVDSTEILVNNFLTPGSYQGTGTLTAHNYPAWNNPVGLFALLRTPKLLGYNGIQHYTGHEITSTITGTSRLEYIIPEEISESVDAYRITGIYQINQFSEFKFRLDDIIHYRLNHSVDIDFDSTKLYGLLEVELENTHNIDELGPRLSNEYPGSTSSVKDAEYEFTGDFELLHGFKKTTGGSKISVVSQWIPMDDIGETLFDLKFIAKGFYNYVDYRVGNVLGIDSLDWKYTASDYIKPLTDPNDIEFDYASNKYKIKKIKLKMMPDIYFHQKASDNNTINTVQVFSYLLYADSLTNNHVSFVNENSVENKTLYTTINISNVTIGPGYPHINETIGNNIYINADTITISGNVNSIAGYNIFIRSSHNINILPQTVISPSISIEITDRIFNKGKIYEATNEEVESFCTGTNKGYHADVLSKRTIEKPKTEIVSIYKVIAYPNPAQNQLFVAIESELYATYNFTVRDLTGKTLIQENKRSSPNPTFEIDLSALAKGMYFLEVTSAGQKTYKTKFIKM